MGKVIEFCQSEKVGLRSRRNGHHTSVLGVRVLFGTVMHVRKITRQSIPQLAKRLGVCCHAYVIGAPNIECMDL